MEVLRIVLSSSMELRIFSRQIINPPVWLEKTDIWKDICDEDDEDDKLGVVFVHGARTIHP